MFYGTTTRVVGGGDGERRLLSIKTNKLTHSDANVIGRRKLLPHPENYFGAFGEISFMRDINKTSAIKAESSGKL